MTDACPLNANLPESDPRQGNLLERPTPLRLRVRTLRCDLEAGEISAQLCADPHQTPAPELLLVQSPQGVYRLTLSGLHEPCVTNLGLSCLGSVPDQGRFGGEVSQLLALALFPALRRGSVWGEVEQAWSAGRPLVTSIADALRLTGVRVALTQEQGALALLAASDEVRERLLACGRPPAPSEANERAVAFTALALLAAAGQLPGHDPDQLWDLGEHWSEV